MWLHTNYFPISSWQCFTSYCILSTYRNMNLYICSSKVCCHDLMSLLRYPSTMSFSHVLESSLHALMNMLHIKLVSAEDNVVVHFVYTTAHTKPETKLTAMLWRRIWKLRPFFTCLSLKKEINLCQ
jgi:hypothetical protein